MSVLTAIGGLLIAIYLAVSSQTVTSPTFKLIIAVAAGILFIIDIFYCVRAGGWGTRRTVA
jgi:hypothetical protein